MSTSAGGAGRFAVIVPALNAAGHIAECLGALTSQVTVPEQIIVVDDGSIDDTAAIARSFGVRVHQAGRLGGPAAARNRGAALADARVLIFVDADVVVFDGALAAMLAEVEASPEVAAAFGSYDDRPPSTGLVSRYRNLFHHWTHQNGSEQATTFWSGFGAVRRDVFEALGGFDPAAELNFIEDIELGYRIRQAGYSIRLNRTIQCRHLKRWTLWGMVRTDALHRALPWARLLLSGAAGGRDLNLSGANRAALLSTVLAAGMLAASVMQPWLLIGVALMLAVLLTICHGFFRFLAETHGLLFAVGAVPVHALHYLSGAAGLILACWSLRRLFLMRARTVPGSLG